MKICTTVLMLLYCVCMYAQNSRSMSYEAVVQQLGAELQNHAKDNEFQYGIRFRVTIDSDNEIRIEQTWLQGNGRQDRMVLSFHPRDIIYVNKRYYKDAMGLAIRCREDTVVNYWLDVRHRNDSVHILCLQDDFEAVARIEKTFLRLKELSATFLTLESLTIN